MTTNSLSMIAFVGNVATATGKALLMIDVRGCCDEGDYHPREIPGLPTRMIAILKDNDQAVAMMDGEDEAMVAVRAVADWLADGSHENLGIRILVASPRTGSIHELERNQGKAIRTRHLHVMSTIAPGTYESTLLPI